MLSKNFFKPDFFALIFIIYFDCSKSNFGQLVSQPYQSILIVPSLYSRPRGGPSSQETAKLKQHVHLEVLVRECGLQPFTSPATTLQLYIKFQHHLCKAIVITVQLYSSMLLKLQALVLVSRAEQCWAVLSCPSPHLPPTPLPTHL